MALMGPTSPRRGIKKVLAFAGRVLGIAAVVIGWFTETILFPIPFVLDMPDWRPFKRRPFLIYPPLITGCYVSAVLAAIISNYFLAIVLAITGTFLIVLMRSSLDEKHEADRKHEAELLFPSSEPAQRAWAASEQVPAGIRAQFQEIILARDIPVEAKTVVCALVLGAAEGIVPEVWPPTKALEDLDSRVEQFVMALSSWMRARQAMLKALGNAGKTGLSRRQLMNAVGRDVPLNAADVPWAQDILSEMAERGEVVTRSMTKKPSWERYWLPEHAPVSNQGP